MSTELIQTLKCHYTPLMRHKYNMTFIRKRSKSYKRVFDGNLKQVLRTSTSNHSSIKRQRLQSRCSSQLKSRLSSVANESLYVHNSFCLSLCLCLCNCLFLQCYYTLLAHICASYITQTHTHTHVNACQLRIFAQ